MELGDRSRKVLQSIVEEYIDSAKPVSSSVVGRRCKQLQLSSATIRHIMAQLEEHGFLQKPHTSAGRIPTDKGIRIYVDGLVAPKLHPWDKSHLEATTTAGAQFPVELSERLAGLSGQVAVVALPRFLGSALREMGLVRVGAGRFLAYVVSPSGLVQQKLIAVDFDLAPHDLQTIQNFLNERLGGRTLAQVRELIRVELSRAERNRDDLQGRAWQLGHAAMPPSDLDVLIARTSHLANQPEFSNQQVLARLLSAIEQRKALLQLLDQILDAPGGVQVRLHSELCIAEMRGLAYVGSTLEGGPGTKTVITLLGPTRMDYGRLMPMVHYATRLFGRYLEQL